MNWFQALLRLFARPTPRPSPYPITGRDAEFTDVITALYQQELGRDPDPGGMASWLHAAQYGSTGDQIREALHNSPEGIAYRNSPPQPDPVVTPIPTPTTLYPLSVDGVRFVANRQTWHYSGLTAFTLLADLIAGKDMEPFMRFAHEVGANTLRIFGMLSWANLYPQRLPDYFDKMRACLNWCTAHGFYVEWTIFASANEVMPDRSEQDRFYRASCDVLADYRDTTLVSLSNENDLSVNQVDVSRFPVDRRLIFSSGSSGGDVDPQLPARSYTEFHHGRNNEWPRKLKSAREFADTYGVPCTNNETNRPDLAGFNVDDFMDAGYVGALLTAGVNGHSEALKRCNIPTGPERDCVAAILKGNQIVPPDVYRGHYTRGGLSDCPLWHDDAKALRTFGIIQGAKAYAVIVRPSADNPRQAVNGWRVTRAVDNYYELSR